MSNEIQLIIESCKTDKDNALIKEKILEIKNWKKFINLAYTHGVFPLVYHTLKNHKDIIPEDILQNLKYYNMNIVKENMLLSAELIKTMKFLEKNNIEAISFKGPTLSQLAYGDITLRQYCDLDILIKKEDVYKIEKLFLEKDFKRNLTLTKSQESTWFKYAHDLGMISTNGTHVEFHWSMLDTDHPVSLANIDFSSELKDVQINGKTINTISNEKFLVYLCVHGSKHLFERVEWVCDIDRFIRTQDIDWNKVDELVKNTNHERFFYLGVSLTNKLFKTQIPSTYIKNCEDKNIEDVMKHIFNLWNKNKIFNAKNNIKYMLKLFISTQDKLSYLHKFYMKPTFNEYWLIDLPKPLYFLYYFIRQYLLIKKYFYKK